MCHSYFIFSRHDVIVTKLTNQPRQRKEPQSYTNNDIKLGIDGLYIAIQRQGAPRTHEEVVIGNGISERIRRDFSCKCVI